ncbi:ATP-binding protein [Polycladomyces zharkentensis]|nr:ATP-binding protein [Polycladomyces sp. WAk]
MIPEEFVDARLDNYKVETPVQQELLQMTKEYLARFDEIKDTKANSMGFVAEVGEQQIRRIGDLRKRAEYERIYNSYGLGKTHLQMAAAKELIRRGYAVLCISDTVFMNELVNSKRIDDGGIEFNRLMGAVVQAPVLVWDDIGKSKYSETKEDLYYQIINERYKARRPILFSSNEDPMTLSEKIGPAAFSRLSGMAKDFFLQVKGDDYRMRER